MNAKDEITKARVSLLREQPFFAHLSLYLIPKEFTPEILSRIHPAQAACATMAVDGKGNLYYDSKFVESLKQNEVKGVLCHEVMHLALQHIFRKAERDILIWNIATDIAINSIILSKTPYDLPKDSLIPNKTNDSIIVFGQQIKNVSSKSAEEIYHEIYNNIKKQCKSISYKGFDAHLYPTSSEEGDVDGEGKGSGNGKSGSSSDIKGSSVGEKLSPTEIDRMSKQWKERTITAATHAKTKGNLPEEIARMIDAITEDKVNWKVLLMRYVQNTIVCDYSWSRPSKRSFSVGAYLPRTKKEGVECVISIDTSGSISSKEIGEFLGEMQGMKNQFQNAFKATVLICDCEIHNVVELDMSTSIDEIIKSLKGGGGTSHRPISKWIKENKPDCKILISFTDLYTDFPDNFNIPTIWAVPEGTGEEMKVPFGEIVVIPKV